MGAWGPAVFSDDVAIDVRDRYKEEVANDVEGPEATRMVLADFADVLDDPDEGQVVWLALAATQWKLGRLEDKVRARALEIIDTGIGLGRWEEQGTKLLAKRKAALQKLRDQLVSPQPPPKKIRKPFCPQLYLDLQSGDAISYQMQSGDYVIFRCVEKQLDRLHGAFLKFDLLDWVGAFIPSPAEIRRLPYAKVVSWRRYNVFSIHAWQKRDFPADRIQIVARDLRVHQPDINANGGWGMSWETVEESIQENFRLTPGGPNWLQRLFKR